MKIARISALLLTLTLCGCNPFAPRPAEDPDPLSSSSPRDYFNLRGILTTTSIGFRTVDLEELFADTMVYEDAAGRTYRRTAIIAKLNTIAASIENGDIRADFDWGLLDNRDEPTVFDKSRTIILYRQYTDSVWYSARGDSAAPDIFTGTARFDLRFSYLRDAWTITFWKDIPSGLSPSFFQP